MSTERLMFDILVAGEINPDLILTGDVEPAFGQVEKLVDTATLAIGSSSAIFACGAARLGLKLGFVGYCGDDVFGRFMLDEMHKRDVDTSDVIVRAGASTGLSVILNRAADRAILTFPGLIPALKASDIPDRLLRQARHLHVASYFLQTELQPGLPDLFRRAHAAGLTTSLDTNYDPSEEWAGLDELLRLTDVFLPNQKEALAITRAANVEQAARQLAKEARTVAIKMGAEGGLACHDNQLVRARSIEVNIADSVGAGDAFDGGFLYGTLNGWELQKSLQLACACGALSMRSAGGTHGQATFEEALQHVPG
jgi:sugar/nucleoside kinase (ribokinase family)